MIHEARHPSDTDTRSRLVLHNRLYAKFRDDLEDIIPTANLPTFQEMPYSPEPVGYWADPSRIAGATVPGVAQVEWTGKPGGGQAHARERYGIR